MRCTIIHNKINQHLYNFIYKSVIVEATIYPKTEALTSLLLEKSNISGDFYVIPSP